jgi:hypothetical protein
VKELHACRPVPALDLLFHWMVTFHFLMPWQHEGNLLPPYQAGGERDAQPVTEQKMDAHRCPDRCNTARNPSMSSHQPHRGADEETKSDRKTQKREKEKGDRNDYQDFDCHPGSRLKEGFPRVGRTKLLRGYDDSAGGKHVANPCRQKPGARTIVRMVRELARKEDHYYPQHQDGESTEDSRMPHASLEEQT